MLSIRIFIFKQIVLEIGPMYKCGPFWWKAATPGSNGLMGNGPFWRKTATSFFMKVYESGHPKIQNEGPFSNTFCILLFSTGQYWLLQNRGRYRLRSFFSFDKISGSNLQFSNRPITKSEYAWVIITQLFGWDLTFKIRFKNRLDFFSINDAGWFPRKNDFWNFMGRYSWKKSGFFFQKWRWVISQNSFFQIEVGFFFQEWRWVISRFLDFFSRIHG